MMQMDTQSLIGLEYFTLLEHLASFTRTPIGRELALAIRPGNDLDHIQKELRLVTEARTLLDNGERLPLEELTDVRPVLRRVALEGALLDGAELLKVFILLRVAAHNRSFFLSRKKTAPGLCNVAEPILPLEALASHIDGTVDPDGSVKDTASPQLVHIRRNLHLQKQKVLERLHRLFQRPELRHIWQDTVISFRNGRFVLPVKSGSRHSLPGIVHDFSQSKATCFVEPWDTVELNNELSMLVSREGEEVERIIRVLSGEVWQNLETLHRNLKVLITLDVIFAKAWMSRLFDGHEPEFSPEEIDLKGAVHPLLVFRNREQNTLTPVPLDIRFPGNITTLIVSGANMGGKTVALKTLGLLSLMVQSGMHIPVIEGSRIKVFSSVSAVIGDEQDLIHDLSSFSSHIRRIVQILAEADASSLVLLDELCTNTDPEEGAALALAVLDYLSQKGARVMVTTHYSSLKAYGITKETAVNVSVKFDPASHAPSFGLIYGTPGLSNALEIAKGLGLPSEVIERAGSHLSSDGKRTLRLISDMERTYTTLQEKERVVSLLEESLSHTKGRYERLALELEESKERILDEERRRARIALKHAQQCFQRALRSLKNGSPKPPADKEVAPKKNFQQIAQELMNDLAPLKKQTKHPTPRPLEAGCVVRIKGGNQLGTIVGLDADEHKMEVLVGGLRIRTARDQLEYIGPAEDRPPQSRHQVSANFAPGFQEVNLIGLTVEDALEKVDKIIDQAILSGLSRVDLVHGVGTGALRRAIQEHLREHALVKSFEHPDVRRGGLGVTVVELKD
jgi:DNA mismatch repair protein MutS2